jgi:cohesin loading factor subunit SCC2
LQPKLGDPEEDRTQYLQRLLLEYLNIHSDAEHALKYTRDFYIAQWYVDSAKDVRNQQQCSKISQNGEEATPQRRKLKKKKNKRKKG